MRGAVRRGDRRAARRPSWTPSPPAATRPPRRPRWTRPSRRGAELGSARRAARRRSTDERRLHDELDRAYTDLRTDLNVQLRPEMSRARQPFLAELTDGRYDELELDDSYNLIVLEDGVPKPVISGGEEDLANLVLRLAISQMIAERAGQSFSLLILDEVFGSLDEARRAQCRRAAARGCRTASSRSSSSRTSNRSARGSTASSRVRYDEEIGHVARRRSEMPSRGTTQDDAAKWERPTDGDVALLAASRSDRRPVSRARRRTSAS